MRRRLDAELMMENPGAKQPQIKNESRQIILINP